MSAVKLCISSALNTSVAPRAAIRGRIVICDGPVARRTASRNWIPRELIPSCLSRVLESLIGSGCSESSKIKRRYKENIFKHSNLTSGKLFQDTPARFLLLTFFVIILSHVSLISFFDLNT